MKGRKTCCKSALRARKLIRSQLKSCYEIFPMKKPYKETNEKESHGCPLLGHFAIWIMFPTSLCQSQPSWWSFDSRRCTGACQMWREPLSKSIQLHKDETTKQPQKKAKSTQARTMPSHLDRTLWLGMHYKDSRPTFSSHWRHTMGVIHECDPNILHYCCEVFAKKACANLYANMLPLELNRKSRTVSE